MICVLALTLTMSVCAFAADEVTDDEVANYKSAAETLISQIAGFSDEEIETYLAQNDAFTTATMESWKGVKMSLVLILLSFPRMWKKTETLLRSQPLLSLKKQKQMLS